MDFEEFVKLMVAKNQFSFNEEEAKEAFHIFDRDCRGFVMSDELRQVFQTLEEKIPDHEINDMLQDQKHQFQRKITFDGEYKNKIKNKRADLNSWSSHSRDYVTWAIEK